MMSAAARAAEAVLPSASKAGEGAGGVGAGDTEPGEYGDEELSWIEVPYATSLAIKPAPSE